MGCMRSTLERTVCNSDEADFLTRWKRSMTDNSIGSSQSSSDISFIKLEEKDTQNMASGTTCQAHWSGELPELLSLILLALLVLTLFRRWQAKQRAKKMRRAMAQTFALQSVSATIPYSGGPRGPDQAWKGMGACCLD